MRMLVPALLFAVSGPALAAPLDVAGTWRAESRYGNILGHVRGRKRWRNFAALAHAAVVEDQNVVVGLKRLQDLSIPKLSRAPQAANQNQRVRIVLMTRKNLVHKFDAIATHALLAFVFRVHLRKRSP